MPKFHKNTDTADKNFRIHMDISCKTFWLMLKYDSLSKRVLLMEVCTLAKYQIGGKTHEG